jgi:hypothetical protein
VVQSVLSAAIVDASVTERAGEGRTTEDVSATCAVGAVQSDATPSTMIATPMAMGARDRPSAA